MSVIRSGSGLAKTSAPLFRTPSFLFLWSSQALALPALHVMTFVLLTRLFEMTGSSLATSFLWLAYALPTIMIGPFVGAVVDAREPKGPLAVSLLVRAAAVLFLAVNGQTPAVLIYGVVLLYSSMNQFTAPAVLASFPYLLTPSFYSRATGLLVITQQSAMLVGFTVGGLSVQGLGAGLTLALCGGALLLALVCVLLLPAMKGSAVGSPAEISGRSAPLVSRMTQGYAFLRERRDVLAPFGMLLAGHGGLAVLFVNVPVIARNLIGIPPRSAGLAIVMPFAAGSLIGAAVVPALLAAGRRKKHLVEAGLGIMAGVLALLVVGLPLMEGWPRIAAGSLLSFCFGLAFLGIVVPSQTMIQERTPGGLQGRIFGSLVLLTNMAAALPVLLSGTMAQLWDIRWPLGSLAIGLLVLLTLSLNGRGEAFIQARRASGRLSCRPLGTEPGVLRRSDLKP